MIPKTELRTTSMVPLLLALDSKNSKLCGYAIDGLKKLVTDARFFSLTQEEKYEEQMTAQVLSCLNSCPQLPDDVLVAIMKVSYSHLSAIFMQYIGDHNRHNRPGLLLKFHIQKCAVASPKICCTFSIKVIM